MTRSQTALGRSTTATVLVIGGGPAGAACAIRLRQHGVVTELAERADFPRGKVCGCCLGRAGLDALASIGCRDLVESIGVSVQRWQGSLDGRPVAIDLPCGRAISRERLDSELLGEAARLGATIRQPATARIEATELDRVRVELRDDGAGEVRHYDAVVIASGLNAGSIERSSRVSGLPWIVPPHGPFGAGFAVPRSTAGGVGDLEPRVIYMAVSDDGYVGMVGLEDGRIDVAAALRRRRARREHRPPLDRILGILRTCRLPLPPIPPTGLEVRATGPLRRERCAGRGRLLAIGDAAGYVEPFTGEGMTWGIQSAVAAADRITADLGRLDSVGDRWAGQLRSLMRARRRRCWLIASALERRPLRSLAAVTLRRFPALADPLVRGL